jgi:hypothetical protein
VSGNFPAFHTGWLPDPGGKPPLPSGNTLRQHCLGAVAPGVAQGFEPSDRATNAIDVDVFPDRVVVLEDSLAHAESAAVATSPRASGE